MMMIEDFHKPFIKSLVIVAIVTLFTLVASKYMINHYMDIRYFPPPAELKTIEYSTASPENTIK